MNFALALNLCIGRLGSALNGLTLPWVYKISDPSVALGNALLVGTAICVISTIAAIALVIIDKRAEQQNPLIEKATVSDEDKFQFKDLTKFKLPFWILVLNCFVTYMTIFPYI